MKKSTLGFLLGLFFGILGLLGLFACGTQEEKDEFMSGWWKSFIISIVVVVILVIVISCSVCAAVETINDYYY